MATVTSQKIVVVEDDDELRGLVVDHLRRAGLPCSGLSHGADVVSLVNRSPPALVVLDIGLPDADGRDVCLALRASGFDGPVLFLTARDAVVDRVSGFDAGGDDYLVKPFALAELLARVRALLRRNLGDPTSGDARLEVGDLALDLDTLEARRGGALLELTRTEMRLLELFMRNAGRVLSRTQMLDRVWGVDAQTSSNGVEVYVGYLRRKLEAGGGTRQIHTVRGAGYVLKP